MTFLVDESVSYAVVEALRELGHVVLAVAEDKRRGSTDEALFRRAQAMAAVIPTRDHHFTRPVRFHPAQVGAIVDIRTGNLTANDERLLVEGFLASHPEPEFRGRLVTLARRWVRIR